MSNTLSRLALACAFVSAMSFQEGNAGTWWQTFHETFGTELKGKLESPNSAWAGPALNVLVLGLWVPLFAQASEGDRASTLDPNSAWRQATKDSMQGDIDKAKAVCKELPGKLEALQARIDHLTNLVVKTGSPESSDHCFDPEMSQSIVQATITTLQQLLEAMRKNASLFTRLLEKSFMPPSGVQVTAVMTTITQEALPALEALATQLAPAKEEEPEATEARPASPTRTSPTAADADGPQFGPEAPDGKDPWGSDNDKDVEADTDVD